MASIDTDNLIANLIGKLPTDLQTPAANLVTVYARLTAEELLATWALALAGDTSAALTAALKAMTQTELDADCATFSAAVQATADANAANVKAQKTALSAIASAILSILLAAI
jgi:hypothetical protein